MDATSPTPPPPRRTRSIVGVGIAVLIAIELAGGAGVLVGCDDGSDAGSAAATTAPTTTAPDASPASPASTAASGATTTTPDESTTTIPPVAPVAPAPTGSPPATAPRRVPTIEAAGDLEAQPFAAGPPTSATGLSASFELGLDRQATGGTTIALTWPAQSVPGFDHYVVLRRIEPGLPDEVTIVQQADPGATSFAQDLATTVDDGTDTVSFRAGVIDHTGALVKVSTTLTVRLRWP